MGNQNAPGAMGGFPGFGKDQGKKKGDKKKEEGISNINFEILNK